MKRAVWILRKIYIDEGTPELLMHRAKMLQFKIEVPHPSTTNLIFHNNLF